MSLVSVLKKNYIALSVLYNLNNLAKSSQKKKKLKFWFYSLGHFYDNLKKRKN